MWIYEKKLEYPVKVSCTNPALAMMIMEQFGGADGELAAGIRYLSQRFSMPTNEAKGILTDIGTEELAHWEIIATIVYKLTKDADINQIKGTPYEAYFANHDRGIYPANAAGVPWTAAYIASKGDPVADLYENLAAEQKARATYDHLIKLSNDPGVTDALKFLRQREVVHFQRFGEALRNVEENINKKKFY